MILFVILLIIIIFVILLLGENVGFCCWVVVIVGLCGVLVVLCFGVIEFLLGYFVVLVVVFCGVLVVVIVCKVGKEECLVVMIFYLIMGNFILMGVVILFVYELLEVEYVGGLLVIVFFGLIVSYFVI